MIDPRAFDHINYEHQCRYNRLAEKLEKAESERDALAAHVGVLEAMRLQAQADYISEYSDGMTDCVTPYDTYQTPATSLTRLESEREECGMSEWQPIETAPRDGSCILLANSAGAWFGKYLERYQSGFKPDNPWHSMMLNHSHIKGIASRIPTHWMPLPPPPQ